VKTSEGAKLAKQQEERMQRTARGGTASPRSQTNADLEKFMSENRSVIDEGRHRAQSATAASKREDRLNDLLGSPRSSDNSSAAQAKRTMQLALRLRQEGKTEEADLMEMSARELDEAAAVAVKGAGLSSEGGASAAGDGLTGAASRRMDTSAEGRANLDAVKGMLSSAENEKLVQAGRRRAESKTEARSRSGSRLDSILGTGGASKSVSFETESETEAWNCMDLGMKLRSQGKEDEAQLVEDMAMKLAPEVVSKFNSERH